MVSVAVAQLGLILPVSGHPFRRPCKPWIVGFWQDAAGPDYWLDELEERGASLKGVAASLLNSPEFQARTGSLTNDEYVEFLYRSALGRPSDPEGKAYLVAQLNAGQDRADLLIGFSESAEHRNLTTNLVANGFYTTDDTYQAVALLYDSFTGRKPDAAGLVYWSELLKRAEQRRSRRLRMASPRPRNSRPGPPA